jgi:hypothetical protein
MPKKYWSQRLPQPDKEGKLIGYSLKKSLKERRNSLLKQAKGSYKKLLSMQRRLTLISNLTKKSQKENSIKYKKDADWLRKQRK